MWNAHAVPLIDIFVGAIRFGKKKKDPFLIMNEDKKPLSYSKFRGFLKECCIHISAYYHGRNGRENIDFD